jgi:hypothetical protein
MHEFQVHAPPNETRFQHGTTPGGTGDADAYRIETKFRMAADQSFAVPTKDHGANPILGFDFEYRAARQIVEIHTPRSRTE